MLPRSEARLAPLPPPNPPSHAAQVGVRNYPLAPPPPVPKISPTSPLSTHGTNAPLFRPGIPLLLLWMCCGTAWYVFIRAMHIYEHPDAEVCPCPQTRRDAGGPCQDWTGRLPRGPWDSKWHSSARSPPPPPPPNNSRPHSPDGWWKGVDRRQQSPNGTGPTPVQTHKDQRSRTEEERCP